MLVVSVRCISEPLTLSVDAHEGLALSYVRPHGHLVLGVVQVNKHIRPCAALACKHLGLGITLGKARLMLSANGNKSLQLYLGRRIKEYKVFGVIEGVFAVIGKLFGLKR